MIAERNASVLELAKTMYPEQIAEATGLTLARVRNILSEHNVKALRKPHPSNDAIARVAELARTMTPQQIAEATGRSLSNVYMRLSEQGISAVRAGYTGDTAQQRANCLAQWTPERREARELRKVMRADRQPPEPLPPEAKIDPRKAAEEALIHAYRANGKPPLLEVDALGFKLRGRRAGFDAVMRLTNSHRLAWGMPQLDVNPSWRVDS